MAGLAAAGAIATEGGLVGSSSSPDCTPTPTPAAAAEGASPSPESGDARLALSLTHEPSPLRPGEPVRWSLSVRNSGDEAITLTFASGQDGDVVLSQGGTERYRWSDGRGFTQALREVELGAGATRTFTLEDTLDVAAGEYDLVASLTSDPAPPDVRRRVTVGDASGSPSPSPTAAASPTGSATARPTLTPGGTARPTSTPRPTATPTSSPFRSPSPTPAGGRA